MQNRRHHDVLFDDSCTWFEMWTCRVRDDRPLASSHVSYSKVFQQSHFYVRNISRSFPLSHPTNNPLQYHFYIPSTRYLTFYIPVICSERKSSPMYMIDGTVPQLNSIRTRPWFVFLSNCDVVDVVFYSFYSQMKSWYLIHYWQYSERSQLTFWTFVFKYATSLRLTISCHR